MLKHIKSLLAVDKDKKDSGFTIVEVMIVLAVAGLILAVVFIAVPALQRNQRNSARKNDVAYLKSQINTLVSNNNGRLTGINGASLGGIFKTEELNHIGVDNGVVAADIKAGATAALTDGNIYWSSDGTTANDKSLAVATADVAVLLLDRKCAGTTNIVATADVADVEALGVAATGSSSNIAILYSLEGDTNIYCEDTTL